MFHKLVRDEKLQQELKLNPEEAIKRHFEIPARNAINRTKFTVSKAWTDGNVKLGRRDAWNKITDNIILGTIPRASECEQIIQFAEQEKMKSVGLVMSFVDYFESGGASLYLRDVATPLDWNKKGINHYSMPMLDFGADVPVECLVRATDAMRACIQNGKSVYVHCKAGVGRSAMQVAIYLAIYDKVCQGKDAKEALENAIAKIKNCRHQINLEEGKKAKAIQAIELIQRLNGRQTQSFFRY